MKIVKIYSILLLLFFFNILCSRVAAQSVTDDCTIYENVLNFLNKKQAEIKYHYEYEDGFDPESDDTGKAIPIEGILQHYFFIENKKSDFGYNTVNPWFSDLMKDKSLIKKKYLQNEDSMINCTFGKNIKYQINTFSGFTATENEYIYEERDGVKIHYNPFAISFSKILYIKDNRALVYVKIFQGVNRRHIIFRYGFVFKKINNNWVLSSVEGK